MSLQAQVQAKIASKQNPEGEATALKWVFQILGEQPTSQDFATALKDGTVLCRFVNKIQPNAVKKINKPMGSFQCMENLTAFNDAIKKLGVNIEDTFQSVDLYEKKNIGTVVNTLQALGSQLQVNRHDLPSFGPKPSTENKRDFTEEQMRAGENVIGLQAGFNKGASQAGQNFGNTRHM